MRISISIMLVFLATFIYSQTANNPCPRNQPVTAYHTKEAKVFLFGGFCSTSKTRLNDLWKFDGKRWEQVESGKAPESRSGHAMVYDPLTESLVIFGGKNNEGVLLNDLWAWDGVSWKLLSDTGPAPRQSHRMAVDNENGDVFLFGGSNAEKQSLNDFWVYKDGNWTMLDIENPPLPRLQHTLVYDQHREKIILFGGFDRTEQGKTVYGDTWEWSLKEGWNLKDQSDDMARDHHAMVYDLEAKNTILFGGYNQGYLGDTWSWDGEKWELKATDGPSRAGKPGLMFNDSEKSIILFGGGSNENMHLMDFWQFDAKANLWRINMR